jgi:PAS domain S-box-containing protein
MSSKHKSSSFVIHLAVESVGKPVTDSINVRNASPEAPTGHSYSSMDGSKPAILVIENDAETNRFVVESLQQDYRPVAAFDGQQGREKALISRPVLIITDIIGTEMLAGIGKYSELRGVPVLVLSEPMDEDLKAELLDRGVADFLTRPFTKTDLLVRVKNLVRLRTVQDELVTARQQAQDALHRSQQQLEAELADSKLLQGISAALIEEDNLKDLYEKIMDAAVEIMRSDFASMQMLYPERGQGGELRLLAFRGFDPQTAEFWKWVSADSTCSCGVALKTAQRVIVADREECDFIGADHLNTFRQAGIRSVQSTPLVSRSGKIVGMISTHWSRPHHPSERDLSLMDILARQAADLVERKRNEEMLRHSKQHLDLLSNRVPALISYVGPDRCYRTCNEAYRVWFGLSKDEVIGRHMSEVLGQEAWKTIGPNIDRAFTGETVEYETEAKYSRGGTRWIHAVYSPHHSPDGILGVIVLVTDITPSKRTEQKLRASEANLAEAQRLAKMGSWELDLSPSADFNNNQLHWSDECYRVFGFEPGEVTVTNNLFFSLVHPEDCPKIIEAVADSIKHKKKYSIEHRILLRDGSERIIHELGNPHFDDQGQPVRMLGTAQDITDRRKAEQAIRYRSQQFETLINQAPMGVYLVDADFCLIQVNPVAQPVFDKIAGGVIGRNFDEIIHILWEKSYADEVVGIFRHTLATGEAYCASERAEYRIDLGETEYYQWQVERITLPDGRHGLVCYFRDISDQVQARKFIEESRETLGKERRLYDTVLSNTPDLVYVLDLDHRFTYANKALLTIWGRSWEDAIGKNCLELGYEPWHAARHDREIEQVIATKESITGEVPFSGTHGHRIYEYIFAPVLGADGQVEAIAGTTRDVTERKLWEEKLRFLVDLNTATQRLIDADDIMAVTARMLGEYLKVDRCAYAQVEDESVFVITGDYPRGVPSIVGHWPVEAFGRECAKLMLANRAYVTNDSDSDPRIGPNDLPAYRAANIRAVICVPLHKEGKFTAAMAVHQKSPRVWTAQEIELVELVVARCWESIERTRIVGDLKQTAEDLKRTNEDLEQFAYVSSHDLQEPLRTISNYVDLLNLRQKDKLDADGIKYLRYIQDGAHHARELVQGLLGYANIIRKDDPVQSADLQQILKDALLNIKTLIAENNAKVTYDPLPQLNVNSSQIMQVFQNLISNGIKYRNQAAPEIHISARLEEEKWIFSVRDNGIGIEPEYKDRIFMIFKRLHTQDQYPGTGIGLAICKKIIEQHGGAIWVESKPHKGSTFYFSLKAMEER